ncbi:hypothetical protein WMY93_007593 [Mugilogobius chulae]|uniref:L1 transposable element RRM domain-containing protein n=1 Tax=Mugilogobius chulae TaxID=88201 RepID=A0AAW0PGT3_9GOBI
MPINVKMPKEKGKTTIQSKLSDFGKPPEQKLSKEANASVSMETTSAVETYTEAPVVCDSELKLVKDEILKAVVDLKEEFNGKLNGILKATEETKKQLGECANRIGQAEMRISTIEDDHGTLKDVVDKLEKRNRVLENRVLDLEARSRLNNVRLVNLPEGAEGADPCSFIESWLPDALDMAPMRVPIVVEKAHRIGPKRGTGEPPRPLIMKFLNYKQKDSVMKAARAKKDMLYKNLKVRLYNDLPTEVHKQRKKYDSVRQQLRADYYLGAGE